MAPRRRVVSNIMKLIANFMQKYAILLTQLTYTICQYATTSKHKQDAYISSDTERKCPIFRCLVGIISLPYFTMAEYSSKFSCNQEHMRRGSCWAAKLVFLVTQNYQLVFGREVPKMTKTNQRMTVQLPPTSLAIQLICMTHRISLARKSENLIRNKCAIPNSSLKQFLRTYLSFCLLSRLTPSFVRRQFEML